MNIRKHKGTRHTDFYLFIVYLTTPYVAQNITPSSKLIPDNDLEEVQKEAVVTPFAVPSQNFPAISEENNENPNSKSRSHSLPNTKQQ
jgi:hypothetical protein